MRKTKAKCHPQKAHHAFGLCFACWARKRYRRMRRAGMPVWVANRWTPQGYIGHLESDRRYQRRNRARNRAAVDRYQAKFRERYGGWPNNPIARTRWLIERNRSR